MPRSSSSTIDHVRLTLRGRPVPVEELALMLELDLQFGCPLDFRARLRNALSDAYRQGQQNRQPKVTRA